MNYFDNGRLAARFLKAHGVGRRDQLQVGAYAMGRKDWGADSRIIKAAISGLSTSDLESVSAIRGDFQRALWPTLVIGQLRGLRKVPARVPLLTQTVGSVAAWVGSGAAIRMSAGTFTRDTLELRRVGAITATTNELLADQSEVSEEELLGDLLRACRAAVDAAFLDVAYSTDNPDSPVSITSTATPIVAGAATIAGLDAALQEAVERLVAAGSDLSMASWVLDPRMATEMALARGTAGAPAYPGMSQAARTLVALPVLVSAAAGFDSDNGPITLVDGSQISYAEDAAELSTSTNAMLEQSSTPTADSTTPTGASATLVSMFDVDATALKAVARINWLVRRPGAVQVITGAGL